MYVLHVYGIPYRTNSLLISLNFHVETGKTNAHLSIQYLERISEMVNIVMENCTDGYSKASIYSKTV